MIHNLWGKAKEHPDYNKEEWIVLQRHIERLEFDKLRLIQACKALLVDCNTCAPVRKLLKELGESNL